MKSHDLHGCERKGLLGAAALTATMEATEMAKGHFCRALLIATLLIIGPANAGGGWFRSQDELKNLAKYHECLENNAREYGREEACQICSEKFGLYDNIHLCDPPERP
jgi:hypothetical protein